MASDGISVNLEGVDELRKALAGAVLAIRTKAVRAALREAGGVITKQARLNAPILKHDMRRASPYRKPGTIRANIVTRPSKFARRGGDEGVFISVRPLRGKRQTKLGKAGSKNPNDPFYWIFQEFGWQPRPSKTGARAARVPGRRFMTSAAESRGQQAIQMFMSRVIPQIEKLNAKASRVR